MPKADLDYDKEDPSPRNEETRRRPMDQNDARDDDIREEESFEALLNESGAEPARLAPGQKVSATVVKITADWIFIELGRKGEGVLDKKEFVDAHGHVTVKEGDALTAYFLGTENNELRFTTKIGGGAAGLAQLEDAWRAGIPVEGYVEREVKGGYEVRIAGTVRAFCPFSQMDPPKSRPDEGYGKKHLSFRITRFAERGRNIVLSRRVLLEEQVQAERQAKRASLREGMTVKGTVTSIREFGAFVNAGGMEGLIPVSEIGWGHTEDIRDVLAVGQEVEVAITKLDWVKDRFTFSLKAMLADPWETVPEKFPEGSVHVGKVARIANFGAFVTLGPGVDGLLHISKLGGETRLKHPGEALQVGQAVEVRVENVDVPGRRLSLALAAAADEAAEADVDFAEYAEPKPPEVGLLGELLKAKLAEKGKK
jgi:small subunit ribosomal protein S1